MPCGVFAGCRLNCSLCGRAVQPGRERFGGSFRRMRTAFIGMGGNLPSAAGPPEATLTAAAERLERLGAVTHRSSLYRTEPVGYADQPRFVNAVVALETDLEPRALLEGMLAIEQEFGRDRRTGIPNGPRTLDLDLLLVDGIRLSVPGLEIPHPRLSARPFVLIPLAEILQDDASLARSVSQWLNQSLPDAESDSHEVVKIQWNGWRAGAGRGAAGGLAPAGAEPGDTDAGG
jgi:2-amino-4-hydroxy-6-hydroxymethyldihydropteridine diphosphokinase